MREKEKKVLKYFSEYDLELSPRPFQKVAQALNMEETEVVGILQRLKKQGMIKDLRGVIHHRRVGYTTNALIAWHKANTDVIKKVFMGDDRISHCYKRTPQKSFNYDTFTMMHAKTASEIKGFVRQTAEKFKLTAEILFTEKELKKDKLALGKLL
ncbi:MAG: hypothetical protein HQL24_02750 [Candidatus Omnitrophica bacterium]|nr:hypothetical protein [Candidatus Omnitrophota bacterium]